MARTRSATSRPACPTRSSSIPASSPQYALQYYNGAATIGAATPVTPTLATPATGIDGHLAPSASISGTITDANGNPITSADICVTAQSATNSYSSGATATTDASGNYTLSDLSAGAYDVYASDCDQSARDDLPGEYSSSVVLTASEQATQIDIQLEPATSISGHVYGGTGTTTPLSSVCVDVYSDVDGPNASGEATSESDGLYTVSHLAPGIAYTISFDPSCNGSSPYLSQYYNGASTSSAATTVTPTAASPAGRIDAHLVLGASISGTVTDASGATITSADICVTAQASDGPSGSATSDASGHYTIVGLPADTYDVTASDCAGSSRNDVTSDHGPKVTVTASQAITGIGIKLAAATSVSGHVYAGAARRPSLGSASTR